MIKTNRLTLRRWTMNDLESLIKYANNKNIARNMRDRFPHPYTREAAIDFISQFEKENAPEIFAVDLNGEAIGSAGFFPKDDVYLKNAEFGYWIAEPYWSRGFGTEAARAIIDYGFKNFPVERIYASVFSRNDASNKVMLKLGLKNEATFHNSVFKFGEYRDEIFYAIIREDWKKKIAE